MPGVVFIDLFCVYDFRCCLLKTVLDFRINRDCKKLHFFNNFLRKIYDRKYSKIKATAKLTGSTVCRPGATPQSLVPCVDLRVLLLTFANKSTQLTSFKFPTSCSRANFLILVTVLYLTITHTTTFHLTHSMAHIFHNEIIF